MPLSFWPNFISHKNTQAVRVSTRVKSSEVFVQSTARSNPIAHSRTKPSEVFPLPVKASKTSDGNTRSSGVFCMIWRLRKNPKPSAQPGRESVDSVPPRSTKESSDDKPQSSDSHSKENSDSSAVQQLTKGQTELSVPISAMSQDSGSNTAHQHSIPSAPRDAEQFGTDWDNMDSDSDSNSDSDSDAFSLASQLSGHDPDEQPWVRPATIIRTVVSSQEVQQAQYAEWVKQKPHGTICEPAWLEYLTRHERKRKIGFRSYCTAIDKGFPELEREMVQKLRAIDDRLGVCRQCAKGGRKRLKI